jgi:putative ABC transport system permease protein
MSATAQWYRSRRANDHGWVVWCRCIRRDATDTEIGVRIAVGAQQREVIALIIRRGMQPALAGLAIGLFGAFVLMRILTNQLYEVRPTDPTTFSLVAIGLLLIAFAACFIPARRAARIDPVVALRHE